MDTRKFFGTDGIRGKANLYPMTGEVAMALGRAVTEYFQQGDRRRKPLIVIGKDTRLSCYMLEQAFSAGVCSQGGRAILTGPLPTPGVAFVTTSMRADAGVMISASHNSFEDNGIKIFDRTGHKLPDEIELILENFLLNPQSIPVVTGESLGNAKRLDEVIGRYIVHAKSALSEGYSLEGLRIVLDCANGAAYKLGPMIFEELGAEVFATGVEPNGTNINKKCGALHPELAADLVKKYRADIGICLDGDADRVCIVDNHGKIVDGDHLLGICAKFLAVKNELGDSKEVVGTVMSNLGLEQYLGKQGIGFHRTKVGDRYIMERMKASGALLGGEPSGHIIFKKYSTTGDGILSALKALECLQYFGKTISELTGEFELCPQILKNVHVKDKKPFDSVPGIRDALKEVELKLKGNGRVLLRYSGTENLARVMVEGNELGLVQEQCDYLVQVVDKCLN